MHVTVLCVRKIKVGRGKADNIIARRIKNKEWIDKNL